MVVLLTRGQPDRTWSRPPHEMTTEHKSGFHLGQVGASALAAVTAAVLGSTLGVAGTVLGAAIGAIVTTIAAELYLRSFHRVRTRVTREQADKESKPSHRVRWQLLAGVTVAAFVLGMLVITGVEWVRGSPLSGDQKTTIGEVLTPSDPIQKRPVPKSSPPSTVTVTSTPSDPPATTTTAPPETSGTTPSTTTPPSGTTTDPVQSTSAAEPPPSS